MGFFDYAAVVWLCLSLVWDRCSGVRQDDICGSYNGRRIYLELGERGVLTALNVSLPPRVHLVSGESHEQCSLELVTCPSCIVHIRLRHLSLSPQCGGGLMDTPCRCDYLWLSEPPYEEVSGSPVCGHYPSPSTSLAPTYRSLTRTLALTLLYSAPHAHAFTVDYYAERNRAYVKGIVGVGTVSGANVSQGGVIKSPFFPLQYPRDLGVEYLISCQPNPGYICRISLIFTDFQLASASIIEFYDWNGQRLEVSSGAVFRPPVILTTGPTLLTRFYANGGSGLGYKATYSFVTGQINGKAVKPITDCGGFVENLGGAITMMNMVTRGMPSKAYDCIWLIRPPSNFFHLKTHLYLKVATFTEMVGSSELVVRQGLTSERPILETLRNSVTHTHSRTETEHIIPLNVGFYVSFRGSFGPLSRLAILYTSFTYMDCFTGSDFLCQNHRCIPANLNCDGFDHCGDNSDEPETCSQKRAEEPVDRHWYAHTPNYYFPKMERYPDLKTATLVFIISSLGLIMLIAALVILLYRMGTRARQQRELQSRLQTISELLDGARIEEVVHSDEPPMYEAPPDYEEITKDLAQGKIKRTRRSRSSPGPSQPHLNWVGSTVDNGVASALEQVNTSHPQLSYSCRASPVPDSPPPAYIDAMFTAGFEEPNQGWATFHDDGPEPGTSNSVCTLSDDQSDFAEMGSSITNLLVSDSSTEPSALSEPSYTNKRQVPTMSPVFKRRQYRHRKKRSVFSLDANHLTKSATCRCEGACSCIPSTTITARLPATWSPASYNIQALDIFFTRLETGSSALAKSSQAPLRVWTTNEGTQQSFNLSISVDNLPDLV